ncbi:RING-type E3 ubiquitin transferase [Sarracenia purpurea var. burkii]
MQTRVSVIDHEINSYLRDTLIFTMNRSPTILRPPFPSPPVATSWFSSSSSSSPLISILSLLAFIGVIILIYALFFAMKCPQNPFEGLGRNSGSVPGGLIIRRVKSTGDLEQLVSSVAYKKVVIHGGESFDGGDCPVCLTAFVEGEIIREVNICKHLFHAACIDMWLFSHSNCPVCRAIIAAKPAVLDGEDDLQQGLPDSVSLM